MAYLQKIPIFPHYLENQNTTPYIKNINSKKIVQLLLLEGQKRLVITTSHDPIVLSKAESILNISR